MARASDFHAREGQPIAPLLAKFARYVLRDLRITIAGPAKIHHTATGKKVVFEPSPQTFPGSFRARLRGPRQLEIGEGLVSGLVPTIDEVRLDGLDEDGEPLPEGPPRLTVSPPLVGTRTWVVIITAPSTVTGEIDAQAEIPVRIEHRLELPRNMRDETLGEIWRIVAVLSWTGEGNAARVESVRQVVWYDQEVYLVGGQARYRAAS